MAKEIAPWRAEGAVSVSDRLSDPNIIASHALQLRDRERNQITQNFVAGNYEIASTYIWTRTMALLKRQLSSLGSEFIAELLQRPELSESSDTSISISDSDAISLALDLGVITPLQSKRLFHSLEIVGYFAGLQEAPDGAAHEEMTREEAISCLRVCVQGVLGQEKIEAAEDFKRFRDKLAAETLTPQSAELARLKASPYFFVRTAVSVLLSLFRSTKGAQFEHTARNTLLLLPELWPRLKEPERWQVGQAYAQEFNDGKTETMRVLHGVLVKISGFDYVPENLRSSTFVKAANSVIAAHEAYNNFYNEPAPMNELANLGTSIPGPALAACITAILCVKLGNRWGRSTAAQAPADRMIRGISADRWRHYFDGRLEEDRRILGKLDEQGPLSNWIALVRSLHFDYTSLKSKGPRKLLQATVEGNAAKVTEAAQSLFSASIGVTK